MPESNTSEADQPAVSSSMVDSHGSNHEGQATTPRPMAATGGGGAPAVMHHAHQHHQHHHHHQQQQQQQQMVAPHMFSHHAPHYMPLYPNKPQIQGPPYNGIMLDHGVHEKETVSIYVPNSMVGAIIGKSGSAIKEMISNSGASIKVAAALPLVETTPPREADFNSAPLPQPEQVECTSEEKDATTEDKSQPEESERESQTNVSRPLKGRHNLNANNNIRKVTIVGSPDSQWSAQYMIYRKVALESMGNDVSLMVEIQAPSHLVGKIIGKSGTTIKRLQKQTRTIIRLTDCRPTDPSENEREQQQLRSVSHVQITGDFNGSQIAQRQIRALIRESLFPTKMRSGYLPDLNMAPNTMSQPPYNLLFNNIPFQTYGPNGQYPIQSCIVNSHPSHGGHSITRNMSGGPHHQHPTTGVQVYPNASNHLPLYPNKPQMQSVPYNSGMIDGTNEKEIVCIYVPNSMVGAIIGKSGSAIKDMISNSGASIKVAAALPLVETTPTRETESDHSPPPQEQSNCVLDDKDTPQDKSNPESERESQNDDDAQEMQKIVHPQNPPNTTNYIRKVTIVGTPDSQWSAQYMIYRKVALESMGHDVSLTAEIQVPSYLAGRIIGKSGATIKKLQKQTGTIIRLTDCRPPSRPENESENKNGIDVKGEVENGSEKEQKQLQPVDSCVQITGDFNGSQLAQRQIRNLIKQSAPLKIEVRLFSKS